MSFHAISTGGKGSAPQGGNGRVSEQTLASVAVARPAASPGAGEHASQREAAGEVLAATRAGHQEERDQLRQRHDRPKRRRRGTCVARAVGPRDSAPTHPPEIFIGGAKHLWLACHQKQIFAHFRHVSTRCLSGLAAFSCRVDRRPRAPRRHQRVPWTGMLRSFSSPPSLLLPLTSFSFSPL